MADNATATDLSLLHLAVLERSSSEVRRLLSTKRYTTSSPNPALTTMECALGWPEGLHLLAAAGAVSNPAIELAILRHDVGSVAEILSTEASMFLDTERFAEHKRWYPWSFSRRNDGLCSSALQASLCLHCYHGGGSLCYPKNMRPCCSDRANLKGALSSSRYEIHRLLVAAVKERRAILTNLAVQHLPLQKCCELGVTSDSPLDSNAFATYTALLESGISVPEALYPGKRPLLLSFNILCRSGGFLLTQALFDNGVCDLNTSVDGVSPLVSIFYEGLANGQKELAIRWLLENGARATFSSSDMLPNLLFYLASVYDSTDFHDKQFRLRARWMADRHKAELKNSEVPNEFVLGVSERKTTPTMIGLVAQYCNPVERDTCSCPCSSGGCLPLHGFRKRIASKRPGVWPRRLYCLLAEPWSNFSEILRSWIRDCQLDDTQTREYLRDACRLEVHTRLGMAHTCCIFQRDDHDGRVPRRQERDKELCRELEDEDTELAEQFEGIMEEYDTALSKHQGTIEGFWTRWWEGLQSHLPDISDEEREQRYR